jgi:hypothetical protein
MMARVFWILGAGLSLFAMAVMLAGGPEAGGIVDYRAWLLLAFGLLAVVVGNVSRGLRQQPPSR